MQVLIYGLVDPRSEALRYIGQTRNPRKRYWRHCHPSPNSHDHRDNWIRALAREGLKPAFVELELAATQEDADTLECFWIASLRAAGSRLINFADGGQGGSSGRRGQKLTPEHRAKISSSHKGIGHSLEARVKMSAQRKGRKTSAATREKQSDAQQKRYLTWSMSVETRGRISKAVRESWQTNPTERLYPRPLLHPIKIQHGTTNGYRVGCRCAACAAAHRVDAREYARRKRANPSTAPYKKRIRQNEKPKKLREHANEIKARLAAGETMVALAKEFKVNYKTIRVIKCFVQKPDDTVDGIAGLDTEQLLARVAPR